MKKIKLPSVIVVLMIPLLYGSQARAEISHVSIAVDGLGCPFCVYGIEKQLKRIDGVKKVDIELKTGEVLVTLEIGISPNISTFQNAVKNAGFTPRNVQITAIGKVQAQTDNMYLSLRGSDQKYHLFDKDSANAELSPDLKRQVLELAGRQSLVAVTGTPHDPAQGLKGLSIEKFSPIASLALSVNGMACEMCVARLTRLLEERKEVYQASVSRAISAGD